MTRAHGIGIVLLIAASACGRPEPAPPSGTGGDPSPETDGNFTRHTYERNFVFISLESDSLFLVPWLMKTIETPDTVTRTARAWLARGGVWEGFYSERWLTGPTRSPGQVLPQGSLRLLVRDGNAIDGILFEEGPRSLELILGDVEASWTGARGGAFELLEAAAYIADRRVDGLVLDMARAAAGETPPGGDWALLLSGDSAVFVFAADDEYGGEVEPIYRGWASPENDDLQWPEARVDWRRTEAFPPARRDVPVEWRIWTVDGLVEGELQAVSAEMQSGEGPGPLLPVHALFEVAGEISTVEGTFVVRGLLVHERR